MRIRMPAPVCSFLLTCASLMAALPPARAQQQKPGLFGSIQRVPITPEEVTRAAGHELERLEVQKMQFEAQYLKMKQQLMEIGLRNVIEERVLDLEAKRRGISRNELIDQDITRKVTEPSQQEIG
jgi:hypothetical protein